MAAMAASAATPLGLRPLSRARRPAGSAGVRVGAGKCAVSTCLKPDVLDRELDRATVTFARSLPAYASRGALRLGRRRVMVACSAPASAAAGGGASSNEQNKPVVAKASVTHEIGFSFDESDVAAAAASFDIDDDAAAAADKTGPPLTFWQGGCWHMSRLWGSRREQRVGEQDKAAV